MARTAKHAPITVSKASGTAYWGSIEDGPSSGFLCSPQRRGYGSGCRRPRSVDIWGAGRAFLR
jgi:hypothetical protein